MKKGKHKKSSMKSPNFVPAPTPPSPEPTVIPLPVYDAGGRVKKYAQGGRVDEYGEWVEDWEPMTLDTDDEDTKELTNKALKGNKVSILDIIKKRLESGVSPKRKKAKKKKSKK